MTESILLTNLIILRVDVLGYLEVCASTGLLLGILLRCLTDVGARRFARAHPCDLIGIVVVGVRARKVLLSLLNLVVDLFDTFGSPCLDKVADVVLCVLVPSLIHLHSFSLSKNRVGSLR